MNQAALFKRRFLGASAAGVRAATMSSRDTAPSLKSRTVSMNFGGTPWSAIWLMRPGVNFSRPASALWRPGSALSQVFKSMRASLDQYKPGVKTNLNPRVYPVLNMDAHRKTRLRTLINGPKFNGSQQAFATAVGLSKGRVSQLLDDEEPFGERAAANICDKLELPKRWFEAGAADAFPADMGDRRIPVISTVAAGQFREIVDAFEAGDGHEAIHTDLELSRYAFALQIEGRSMLPEFTEGDRVIIDPDIEPRSGDFVAAKNADGGATFKKYRLRGIASDGNKVFELIPLNTDEFETLRSDLERLEIIGTMVEHRRYRRKR